MWYPPKRQEKMVDEILTYLYCYLPRYPSFCIMDCLGAIPRSKVFNPAQEIHIAKLLTMIITPGNRQIVANPMEDNEKPIWATILLSSKTWQKQQAEIMTWLGTKALQTKESKTLNLSSKLPTSSSNTRFVEPYRIDCQSWTRAPQNVPKECKSIIIPVAEETREIFC